MNYKVEYQELSVKHSRLKQVHDSLASAVETLEAERDAAVSKADRLVADAVRTAELHEKQKAITDQQLDAFNREGLELRDRIRELERTIGNLS